MTMSLQNTNNQKIKTLIGKATNEELSNREGWYKDFKNCPIPDNELLSNLGLFIKRQDLSRMLFMDHIYKKILDVHGVIIEFGVRWGQNLALFESFRGIYEPFNFNRKILGFDTFEGFPSVHPKDGTADIVSVGAYSVTKGYDEYLKQILDHHEKESPLQHIKKYQIVKGDATLEVAKYFEENPETIVALAYFDLDIYEPTKKCLEEIRSHVTRGSIIGFDELNFHAFPGETIAFKEVFGLTKYKIKRTPYSPYQSYIVVD